jgi:hypothetical protein
MRKLIMLFLGLSLFSLTSCIDMLEELHLNKDGSGTYNITFDMSGLFSDPMMKGMLEEMMQNQDGLNLEGGLSQEMDTLIRFADLPASELQKLDRPEFWKQVSMRMVMSERQKAFKTELKLDFSSLDDIDYFYKNLDKIGQNNGGGAMGGGMTEFLPSGGLFKLSKRNLQRLPAPKPSNSMNEEEMSMAKMFFSAATYKTVYHLPGRVAKTNIPGAEVTGNTVTINNSFLDIMEGRTKLEGEIKFKKK